MCCDTPGMLDVAVTKRLTVTYDALQHCIARDPTRQKTLAIDSPLTGRGQELSPTLLLGSALASSMLLAMGAIAKHEGFDLTGTRVEVEVTMAPEAISAIDAIDLTCHFSSALDPVEREKLQRAALSCGIGRSLRKAIPLSVQFLAPVSASQMPVATVP